MTNRAYDHFQLFADARKIVPAEWGCGRVKREIERPVQRTVDPIASLLVFSAAAEAYMTLVALPYVRFTHFTMHNGVLVSKRDEPTKQTSRNRPGVRYS